MSQTFSLVCHETRQYLWIGQGHGGVMETLYSGEAHTMRELQRFLAATIGKPLVLVCDDTSSAHLDYVEITPTGDPRGEGR